jgi:hypothetical protein
MDNRINIKLLRRLSAAHRQFLSGLARAQPDWALLQYPHADQVARVALEARQSGNLSETQSTGV